MRPGTQCEEEIQLLYHTTLILEGPLQLKSIYRVVWSPTEELNENLNIITKSPFYHLLHNLNQQQQQQPTTNRYSTVIDDHASRQPLATSTELLGAEKFGPTLKKSSSWGRKTREKLPHPVTILTTLFTIHRKAQQLGRKLELENLDLSQWRSS